MLKGPWEAGPALTAFTQAWGEMASQMTLKKKKENRKMGQL